MQKLFLIFVLINFIFAENIDAEYKEYLKNQQNQFDSYKEDLNNGFKEYKKELNEGFKQYKKDLSKYWRNPELTTKTTFVEYSDDKKIKKKVDYKNNEIEIQVISKDLKKAKGELAKSLYFLSNETTKSAFEKNPVLKQIDKNLRKNIKLKRVVEFSNVSIEPIVRDMIFKKTPTQKEIINYAIKEIKKNPIKVTKSKIKNMNLYTIKIKLPPKAFLAKAKIYKKNVFNRANQFKLTPALIYSIIHTESSFNPMARSYVPAFGLMQLVPQTAGADAYNMLYGKKKILTPSYLYNANNNILMGSAYLKRIYYGYMKKIKNPKSRLFCTIVAYNTGVGNVACAFNSNSKDYIGKTKCVRSKGDYNINKASVKINKLNSEQVYNHLINHLRYDEAKNYLKKVRKRIMIYEKALDSNVL